MKISEKLFKNRTKHFFKEKFDWLVWQPKFCINSQTQKKQLSNEDWLTLPKCFRGDVDFVNTLTDRRRMVSHEHKTLYSIRRIKVAVHLYFGVVDNKSEK